MFRQETVTQNETILVIGGPLSGDAVEGFHRKMDALCAARFPIITLDFSQTPSLNSAAIGKLIFFQKKLSENGKALQIRGCSEGVHRIFQMIRLDKLIRITE